MGVFNFLQFPLFYFSRLHRYENESELRALRFCSVLDVFSTHPGTPQDGASRSRGSPGLLLQGEWPNSFPIRTKLYALRINIPLKPMRAVPRLRVRRNPPISLAQPNISSTRLRSF